MKKFLLLILLFRVLNMNSQGYMEPSVAYQGPSYENNLISPVNATPSVADFHVRSIIPPDYFTGGTNLQIPLYEIKVGDISVPISIDYNSKGIKVDDLGGSTGIGWNLNTGGSIMRNIKGLPDLKVGWSSYEEWEYFQGIMLFPSVTSVGISRRNSASKQMYLNWDYFMQNRMSIYAESDIISNTPLSISSFPSNQSGSYYYDTFYDEFLVNAPGISDTFIIKNNSTKDPFGSEFEYDKLSGMFLRNIGNKLLNVTPKQVDHPSPGFGLNLQYQPAFNHFGLSLLKHKDLFDFEIKNDKGISYIFNDYDVVETFTGNYIQDSSWNQKAAKNMVANGYNKDVSAWHLNEIRDNLNNRSVKFKYEKYSNNNVLQRRDALVYEKRVNSNDGNTVIDFETLPQYLSSSTETSPFNRNWIKYLQSNRLKTIEFDGGKVEFTYINDRKDFSGEKELNEINIYNLKGELVKKIKFNYIYYNSKSSRFFCLTDNCSRLFLKSLEIVNLDDIQQSEVYSFDYDNPNSLPNKFSNEQDYLGYYNANGYTSSDLKTPKLFYYKSLTPASFLPFKIDPIFIPGLPLANSENIESTSELNKIPVNRGIEIQGDYSLESNINSLKGLLKRITYPTKGYTLYQYENDDFIFEGNTIKAGSARIKNQQIYDSSNELINSIDYSYNEANRSSGQISRVPLLATIEAFCENPFKIYKILVYNNSKTAIELNQNTYVGYSYVKEKHSKSNITKEFKFTNITDYPNISPVLKTKTGTFVETSSIKYLFRSLLPISNTGYKRGFLKSKVLKVDNIVKEKTVNSYKSYLNESIKVKPPSNNAHFISVGRKESFNNIQLETTISQEFLGLDKSHFAEFVVNDSLFIDENYSYKTSGSKLFSKYYPYVAKKNKKTILGEESVENLYPFGELLIGQLPYPSELEYENRISTPYRTIYKKGNETIDSRTRNYNTYSYNNGSTMTFPRTNISSISQRLMNASSFEHQVVDYRDEYGNVVTYHTPDNIYTTLIWGYKGMYPIIEIKNIKFQDLDISKINNIRNISNSNNSQQLLLNAIKDLKNSLPTTANLTYRIYKPLVGVVIEGDENGKEILYDYDGLNRLIRVRDNNFDIIKEYEYNYE